MTTHTFEAATDDGELLQINLSASSAKAVSDAILNLLESQRPIVSLMLAGRLTTQKETNEAMPDDNNLEPPIPGTNGPVDVHDPDKQPDSNLDQSKQPSGGPDIPSNPGGSTHTPSPGSSSPPAIPGGPDDGGDPAPPGSAEPNTEAGSSDVVSLADRARAVRDKLTAVLGDVNELLDHIEG